ncbi:ubiquitin carboxyl-terminal hydrolase 16-like [Ptychodera flava]|uniref:ubiquitin carboxyl-terminal hydrolase 16-like n=1 Tax=Ptychodera flava TaxID=63121 RepID=UPI00396A1D7F
MRVLESSQLTVMTKKKHRLRKQKRDDRYNDSSDETTAGEGILGKSCEHINKSVVLSNVKKALKQATLGDCLTCKKDGGKGKEKSSTEETTSADSVIPDDIEITIWCCLQCGHQGCDRNSPGQHALKHFQTAHSSPHSVVVNLNNWAVWCYECDDDVTFDSNRKLVECIEFVKKQAGVTKTERPSSGKKKEREAEIVEKEKQNVTGKPIGTVLHKAKGLNNLGNTCFFNAVMQSMNQTHVLDSLMAELSKKGVTMTILPMETDTIDKNKKHEESKLMPLTVVLPEAGSLTSAMILFLKMMNEQGKGTVSPRLLFNQVCQKAPRFKGYQQQDSHELLRYLLDGMRSEELKRVKEGILKEFGFQTTVNPKNVEEEIKEKIKDYGKCVNKTFVDSVFGGQLISTVLCEECHVPSEVYEPFLDLSLPITEAKVWPAKGIFQKCKRGSVSSPKSPPANDQDSPPDGVTVIKKTEDEATGPSKHQQKAAKKKAKKEAKQNKKKGKLLKLDDKKESHSENEPLLRDPNDADSETSIDKRELFRKITPPAVHSRDSSLSSVSTGRRGSSVSPLLDDNSEKSAMKEEDVVVNSHDNMKDGATNCQEMCEDQGERTKSGERDSPVSQEAPLVNGVLEDDLSDDNEDDQEMTQKMEKLSIVQGDKSPNREPSEKIVSDLPQGGAVGDGDVNGCHGDDLDGCHGSKLLNSAANPKEMPEVLQNGDIGQNESGDGSVSDKSKKCVQQEQEKSKSETVVLEELGAVGGVDIQNSIEIKKAMVPLGPKYQSREHECSIQSCLSQFTAQELLTGKNKFGCENCTKMKNGDSKDAKIVYTNASKQLLIHHPPPILTLHLKRFQQAGYSLRKVNRHVDFPLMLDLAPFSSENCKDVADSENRICYSLYGVVEHSGRLQGGHYTAYVKVRQPSQRLLNFVQYIQHGRKHNKQFNINKDQQNNEMKTDEANCQDVAMATQKSDQDGSYDVNGTEEEKCAWDNTKPFTDFEPPDNPIEGKWYYISDAHVTEVAESKVLNSQAYILFYERLL